MRGMRSLSLLNQSRRPLGILQALSMVALLCCSSVSWGTDTPAVHYYKEGGNGVTTTNYIYGSPLWSQDLTLVVTYDMESVPDRLELYWNGAKVADTNNLVAGTGAFYVRVRADNSVNSSWTVTMTGGPAGTHWSYYTWVTDVRMIDSISVQSALSTVDSGGETIVTATALKSGVAVSPQPQFSWSASAGTVVQQLTVNQAKFTAPTSSSGSVTITAVAEGRSGTTTITVRPPYSIEITPANGGNIGVGSTKSFSAIARKSDGSLVSPQPSIQWSATNGSVNPTFPNSGPTAEFLAGQNLGPATITARAPATSVSSMVSLTVVAQDDASKTADRDPCCKDKEKNQTADPIFYGTGEIDYYVDDLTTSGFKPLSIRRSYSQKQAGMGMFGKDWVSELDPMIIPRNAPYVEVRLGATVSLIFTEVNNSGTISYVPLRHQLEQLQVTGNDLLLTDQTGNRVLFYGLGNAVAASVRGKIKHSIDEAGNASAYFYDANGRVNSIERVGRGVNEAFGYAYRPDGLVSSIARTVRRNGSAPTIVRSAVYSYYSGAASEFGETAQLQLVEIKDAANNVLTRYHYRYWRAGETQSDTGVLAKPGTLKYVISTGAYDRMAQAGQNPLTATNATMALYAEKYWEYDNHPRVLRQKLRGNEVDGTGTQAFSYSISANPDTYNNWKTKTVETLLDGTTNTVYCNYASSVLVKITREALAPNREWIVAYRYDSQGREIWQASSSAFQGYAPGNLEASDPLLGIGTTGNDSTYIKAWEGLILEKEYYSTTTATATTAGGSAGRLWREKTRQGKLGTPEIVRELKYLLRTGN